jgi:malonyl-CoA O-methyltransferase
MPRLPRFLRRPPRSLSSLEAYARWAQEYPPHAHNAVMRAEEAALLSLLPPLRGRAVLDAAGGSGRYARIALERGAGRVMSLDNSIEMVRMLRAHSSAWAGLATLDALPLPSASIDVILCGLAIGHLPRIEGALAEFGRVLAPGGTVLISDVHPFLFLGGAQRTFQSGGVTYAVEHTIHLPSHVIAAAHTAGLRLAGLLEPALLPQDRASGTPEAPVAIVYHLESAL